MKILIISQYYYPEQFQINEIAPELVRRGHEVSVLCGVPNYPKGVVYEGYETEELRAEREREYMQSTGVRVIHVKQVPRGRNVLQLALNYFSFARQSRRWVHRLQDASQAYDVILAYQLSPITSMWAAVEYKKKHGTPLLMYCLDLWPVSAEGVLKSKRHPLMYLAGKWSREIYLSADRILVTSRPFIRYLNWVNGVPLDRLGYLPQHASAQMLGMNMASKENGVADFMFAGNLGKGQRIEVIIEAARLLGHRADYKIHIVGDGSMRSELEQNVKEYALQDNVVFYGKKTREEMPQIYSQMDALLITLRGNNEVGETMPGKLQTYMTTGKPIFGAINGAAKEVIQEADCGECVPAEDYAGLAQIMKKYIDSPQSYSKCGANAIAYFKSHFTLEHFINGLEEELHKLTNKHDTV